MKLSEVLAVREPLNKLSQLHFSNFRVVRSLANLIKSVNNEVDFFNESFKKLVDSYAEKDECGNPVIVKNGNIKLKDEEAKAAFDKEYADLLNLDVSDNVHKITIYESDFKSPDDILTPIEMMNLDPVIDWCSEESLGKTTQA